MKNKFSPEKTISYTINLLDSVFDNLPIPIVMVNKDSRIIYFNSSYVNFLHLDLSKDEIIGKHIHEIISNSRLPIVIDTKIPEIGSTHLFPDGRTAIGSRIPVIENGEIIGAIAYILFENAQELQKMAARYRLLEKEISKYREILENRSFAKYNFLDIIGESNAILNTKNHAMKIAGIDLPALILGESGVGKELFVHAIHDSSKRKYGPLIRVNCGAIPKELFESEFFGYEEGAFSGAKKEGKKGLFELANQGTIFLDEIAEMPLFMQIKLLRVLQEKEFLKVGGEKYFRCDIRVIAATNRDIKSMVTIGQFREDLYYRLNTLILEVPPLRRRKEDIPLLANNFLNNFCIDNGLSKKELNKPALRVLMDYSWPGNIRELKNIIERAVVLSLGPTISADDIKVLLHTSEQGKDSTQLSLKDFVKQKEREYILKVLQECSGNKTEAARKLGIHRSLLYKKNHKNV